MTDDQTKGPNTADDKKNRMLGAMTLPPVLPTGIKKTNYFSVVAEFKRRTGAQRKKSGAAFRVKSGTDNGRRTELPKNASNGSTERSCSGEGTY